MIPKVVYQWSAAWSDPAARLFMGLQKNPNGTGFRRLEQGDDPEECRYCSGSLIYKYPHSHTKADYDKEHGNV